MVERLVGIYANFKEHVNKVKVNGETVEIMGDPSVLKP